MGWIWSLIVGGVLGALAGSFLGKDVPGGIIGNIVAGFVGSSIGSWLLGDLGPTIGGFSVVPAFIGAVILIGVTSWLMKKL